MKKAYLVCLGGKLKTKKKLILVSNLPLFERFVH